MQDVRRESKGNFPFSRSGFRGALAETCGAVYKRGGERTGAKNSFKSGRFAGLSKRLEATSVDGARDSLLGNCFENGRVTFLGMKPFRVYFLAVG